uniref:SAM domain-containing protein n=1 Tax=Labrus bergylta TaxID=56723 RepID=A0A3Q3FVN1_9LABR
ERGSAASEAELPGNNNPSIPPQTPTQDYLTGLIWVMGLSKRVSLWSVEEVLEWMQDQLPTYMDKLHKAIIKHAISGRVLLRLKDHHLELLGVEAEEQQQEILQDLLLLRVQEEIDDLNDICEGEDAKCHYLQEKTSKLAQSSRKSSFFSNSN